MGANTPAATYHGDLVEPVWSNGKHHASSRCHTSSPGQSGTPLQGHVATKPPNGLRLSSGAE